MSTIIFRNYAINTKTEEIEKRKPDTYFHNLNYDIPTWSEKMHKIC